MSDKNMQIWNSVDKTDTRFTKKAKVNGQDITSLSGTAMVMKATELFGPVGIGWGWKIIEERFDEGHEIYIGEGDKRSCIGREIGHTLKIALWFTQDGQRGEIEQYGCTRYQYKTSYGMTTDGEAPKKSLTDAIKKALSMLGFSADVFLGLHDDADYIKQLKEEEALSSADDKDAEIKRQKEERLAWLESAIETIGKAVKQHELNLLNVQYIREANRRNETAFIKRITKAYEDRKAQLNSPKEAAA
ncbi:MULTISPECIES: hypothetical protein [Pseudomonas]|uniref:Rad52/22 double-strand break repair protein n=1 Tax=Pseudomonas cedrina TaxID=651740 RepID=A0A2S9E2G8_PSECE|nr:MULTISPECIES: hypothetical protein [Pseudomonas]AVJ20973.1 hypothetical protein CLM72_04150 [Pseudomonas sp. MYb193]PRC09031.1 hypothetical protein CQ006_04805 [Pseudomonas cedrina]